MSHIKILLLNLDAVSNLGATLRKALESFLRRSASFSHRSAEIDEIVLTNNRLDGGIICDRCPSVTLMVLSPDQSSKAGPLIESAKEHAPDMPIIIVTEAVEPEEMFALLKLGVADFITPPWKAVDILPRIWRLIQHAQQAETLTHVLKEKLGMEQLIGDSQFFLAEVRKIPLIAKCDASVLISGETGTGKELCARAIHYLSPRAHQHFMPVNCGAIPIELVENELFGHVHGAYTSAAKSQPGLIHEASGGTLFLDEIDCLPLHAQVKLLRFLQEKEYRPLGSVKTRKADLRIIAAANVEFDAAVKAGKLRQDLYYRLNVIPLRLPPLRERAEDIILLASHFLAKYSAKFNRPTLNFSADAIRLLMLYTWPGNVRELEHSVERAVALAEQSVINAEDLDLPGKASALCHVSFQEAKRKYIEQFERLYIQGLLLAYQGNITKSAQAAHKNRRAFWQLIHKHCIDAQSFKRSTLPR